MADEQDVTQTQATSDSTTDDTATVGPDESLYSRDDLVAGAAAFGTTPEVVFGALRGSDKTEFTKDEAEALINAFLHKEV